MHARPWGKPHKPKGKGNLPWGAINEEKKKKLVDIKKNNNNY
jgi:hypothetical protein